jgi:hypothetical protein
MKNLHLKKRHKAILGIILFIVIVLFTVPRLARWYCIKHSYDLVGRNLAIGKIRFNYLTGTLRIQDLKLYEADSNTVFLSFKRLKININYLPLLKNEINVKYIILDDPYVQVLQNGDTFNFSDLMKSDSLSSAKDTIPAKPLKYIINNISINRGYVKYTDKILNNTISMNRVDLNIPGFTWNSDSTRLGVDFRFVQGGSLFSNLSVNQADSTYSVNLKLDSLNLDIIEPYVENSMYISALHGYFSNDMLIKGDMRSIMKLSVSGISHIFDFQLIDTLKRTILSFDDLKVDIKSAQLESQRISLNSIEMTNPFILFEKIDTTNNWLALIKPSPVAQSDTLQQKADSVTSVNESPFAFSTMSITGGKIQLTDVSLRYPFDYTVDNIQVTSSPDIKMPGKKNVSMSAGLNGTGSFKAAALMNTNDINDLSVSVSINQFRMKDMDPYFRHYFGFPVTGGIMNFTTENTLRSESLVSNNSLYFRKFTLGRKGNEKTEYNIPLRLALGVMSDKDGIIDLKAPIEMKGKDVKVGNIRKIIFHAIGTLFVKAALSPVHLIAELFKTDPETLKELHLLLSDPSPDKKNMATVDILADVLKKKPGLNLDFIYCLDQKKASDTVAYIMALHDYSGLSNSSGTSSNPVPDSTLSKFLLGKLPSDTLLTKISLRELCRKYIGPERVNARIDSIKNSQTIFLQNYFSRDKEIAPDRFKIIGTMPDSIKYDKPVPSFRIYFIAGDEK